MQEILYTLEMLFNWYNQMKPNNKCYYASDNTNLLLRQVGMHFGRLDTSVEAPKNDIRASPTNTT